MTQRQTAEYYGITAAEILAKRAELKAKNLKSTSDEAIKRLITQKKKQLK